MLMKNGTNRWDTSLSGGGTISSATCIWTSESEIEFEEAEVAPIPPLSVILNWAFIPSAAVGHNPEDPTLSHIRSDLDALHRRVRQIENDDVRAENKRLRMMLDCSKNRTRDAWRELDRATWHYHHLRRWSIAVENLLPPRLQYQEPPYALPEALLAPVTHNDPRDPL
ncbi:hypothetical protein Tco_1016880 [Tanacetum coccineum]|uniref:Uncharacterized protein n=1 Tax=Tanacetum coccineum TaxID=301880 RepID=A0ABQ5FR39_9ASTR